MSSNHRMCLDSAYPLFESRQFHFRLSNLSTADDAPMTATPVRVKGFRLS